MVFSDPINRVFLHGIGNPILKAQRKGYSLKGEKPPGKESKPWTALVALEFQVLPGNEVGGGGCTWGRGAWDAGKKLPEGQPRCSCWRKNLLQGG